MKKPLPIGIQAFGKIVEGGFLYVDKTRHVYRLLTEGQVYFLSRPRRFGKSLLISVLEAIFQGRREWFKGLWIDTSDYSWDPHPVIRVDFTQFRVEDGDGLKRALVQRMQEVAEAAGLSIEEADYQKQFRDLIRRLSSRGKVVVLVDEYDKPIIDNIENTARAVEVREVLKGFYGVLKGLDEYLRFVFLTGVSKFSKVGVFSGLNNLEDITFSPEFAELPGITGEELRRDFQDEIAGLAAREHLTETDLLKKIEHWYDGFCFAANGENVYNPFSLLLVFKQQRFANFWFETGTPTFLIRLLKTRGYDVRELEDLRADELSFSSYEVDDLRPVPLLLQTGYLTIKGYDPESRLFRLSYPNFEVENAFLKYLLDAFSSAENGRIGAYLWDLLTALRERNLEIFFKVMRVFFAGIPYDIQIKRERYYQTVFYLIFKLLGLQTGAEVRTSRGRIDAVVEVKEGMYIFEFKMGGDAQSALNQARERGYAEPYLNQKKPVTLVGVVFGAEGQGVVDWKAEEADVF